ncbi:hypothetical protein DXB96_01080 [Clostridium sp. OM07-10AC]|nr:hypothetical protein DXB96_01080 [Clostridium sp. OM07-10AC]
MKNMRKKLSILLVIGLFVTLFSDARISAATITLNKKRLSLYVGQTYNLKLKKKGKRINSKIKWISTNKKIVTVSNKGKVKARGKGQATVSAKFGKEKISCRVVVKLKTTTQGTNVPKDTGESIPQKTPQTKSENVPANTPQSTNGSVDKTTFPPLQSVAPSTEQPTAMPDGVKLDLEISEDGKTITGAANKREATFAVIPKEIVSIEKNALGGCRNLKQLMVENGNGKYISQDNCVIEKESNILVLGCQTSKIPSYVKEIGECAFYGCSFLDEIVLPDSITKINDAAFYECTDLQSISIPDSVIDLGGEGGHYIDYWDSDQKTSAVFAYCSSYKKWNCQRT